jgi:hypothetical protein
MEPHRRETDYRQELRTFARTPQMWVPGEEEAGLGVWEKKSKVGDLPEKLQEMRGDYMLGKGFEHDVTVDKFLPENQEEPEQSSEEAVTQETQYDDEEENHGNDDDDDNNHGRQL